MNKYRITLQHDRGIFTVKVFAENEESAIYMVLLAECAPIGAVKKIVKIS